MSDTIFLGRKMRRFDSSPQFDGYSKVIITVSDEIEYSAGTDLGRTLRITNPWGTPKMAEDILARVQGFQYQPYTADGAIMNPAAELGDGITANNVYGGIYTQKIRFGPLLTATVSAPEDEEIDHEYPYKSKPNKEITREAKLLRASLRVEADRITQEVEDRQSDVESINGVLSVQAGQIAAKVSKTGGDMSSFGWLLDEQSWTIQSNGMDILKATKDGLAVEGIITATGGKIGGFTINSNSLSYNNQEWGGTNTTGIYLGPLGLQLGKNFKVDSAGNLTAASGTFSGYVRAGSIQYGGNYGTFSGAGLTAGTVGGGYGGAIKAASLSTFNMVGGINTSLGYADFANGVFNDYNVASVIRCQSVRVGNNYFNPVTIYYTNASGETSYVTVLGHR